MLSYFFLKVVFFILLLVPGRAEEPLINFAEFDAYVEKSMEDWLVPGAAIAIVKDGQIVHLKAYGVSSITSQKPVTLQTIFPLASLTKGFTAAIVSSLIQEGKMQWDDKVRKYLPDFKIADETASEAFTIEDLLSHRSGLPGFAGDSLVETGWSAQEIYQIMHKVPLKNRFASAYDYQNIFPGIAGWIVENIEKKPLSEIYEKYLFQPLQLEQASIGKDGLTGGESLWIVLKKKVKAYFSDRTSQYCQLKNQPLEIPGGNESLYCFEASRGMNASITDMAKWALFHLGKETSSLLSPASMQRMRSAHIHIGQPQGGRLFPKERVKNIAYGMGWFIYDYDRLEVLGHMGGMTGIRSMIALSLPEKVGLVILCNSGGMRVNLLPEAIRSKFFDLYLKLSNQPDWSQDLLKELRASQEKIIQRQIIDRLKNPRAARDFQSYTGTFENDLYGQVNITTEKNKLYMSYKKLKVELTHWNEDQFSFLPHKFSKAYSGNDRGDVLFTKGSLSNEAASEVRINLLQEGMSKVFYRKN